VTGPDGLPDDPTFPPAAYVRMSLVLRVGLLTALLLLGAALATYLVLHPMAMSGPAIASNPILRFLDVPGLVAGLAAGDPVAYLTLGLLVLVATPIVRVASGCYYFRRGRERALTAITFTVVVLLLVGLLLVGPYIR
jgi:uncharacterized membrane protein